MRAKYHGQLMENPRAGVCWRCPFQTILGSEAELTKEVKLGALTRVGDTEREEPAWRWA